MPDDDDPVLWDLSSAIRLLNSLTPRKHDPPATATHELSRSDSHLPDPSDQDVTSDELGDFRALWSFLGVQPSSDARGGPELVKFEVNNEPVAHIDINSVGKGVRWRDERDGADLEDNVGDPSTLSSAYIRNQKRAQRRARAKVRAGELAAQRQSVSDTSDRGSDGELDSLRRSPDRRAVIDSILGRTRPTGRPNTSPPTSPSPPKKRDWPVSNPFLWSAPDVPSLSKRVVLTPRDGLTRTERKRSLITALAQHYADEKKYLKNAGLMEPAFTPLNISTIGIHVFVDMSNISIGFHDCLKLARGLPRETRLRRVPLSFHNFSLVLERGRPAAKRVLVGSDKYAAVQQAKSLGYETNILERVHKAKELTPRQKKYRSGGETSGSETNTTLPNPTAERWVEQAVDEILHLKILESLIDVHKPSTIVLATGDAAEAEYSGGFLKMVERALEKGWSVELVSFKLNTSSLYRRKEFRSKWGPLFKWVELDPFVEFLMDEANE